MAWRSRFALKVLRKFITTRKAIQNPTQRTLQHFQKLYPRYSGFQSSYFGGARRFYHVNGQQFTQSSQRGYKRWSNAMHQVTEFCSKNPKFGFAASLIGAGAVVTVCFGRLETVPYTNRRRFVILPTNLEMRLGEYLFAKSKEEYKGNILPPDHPDSVRVGLIAKNIINVLQRTNIGHLSDSPELHQTLMPSNYSEEDEIWLEKSPKEDEIWVEKSPKEDEIVDNKSRLQKSKREGITKRKKLATEHMDAFKWEVIVVDERYTVNAFCAPGGKIVVFRGLLRKFKTDNEIATILGHEVAHALARHVAEGMTKTLWFLIARVILHQFVNVHPDLVNDTFKYILSLPFSRKLEKEADYVGLFLMASAGYDPRVAPGVFQKLDGDDDDSRWSDYNSTHPSGKKRAELLSRSKVMEEALLVYHQTKRRRWIQENGGTSG